MKKKVLAIVMALTLAVSLTACTSSSSTEDSAGSADTTKAAEEEPEEEENTGTASAETNGTVTVLENVRIRSSASENGEKLGTAYTGEKLELIMKQADGWTKIKYNGKTAYVKSDYVE